MQQNKGYFEREGRVSATHQYHVLRKIPCGGCRLGMGKGGAVEQPGGWVCLGTYAVGLKRNPFSFLTIEILNKHK